MAEASPLGEGDSSGPARLTLKGWRSLKGLLFGRDDADHSLRAQLEEALDEHAAEAADGAPSPAGDLSPIERQMLRNLLHFSEHDADDIAVPRSEVVSVPASASFDELVATFAEHGHSRLPVHGDSIDRIEGMIHIKDVFPLLARMALSGEAAPADWHPLMRQPVYVPQARGALDVLADMRASRTHLAIVIDEYSGTDGIITIEDLVEEIVGEIEDEHDDAPEELLRQLDDRTWDADARAELDDVGEALDPRLAEIEEDIDTIGGLAVVLAGEVPEVGRVVEHPSGWRIEVTEGDERRLTRVRLHAPAAAERTAEDED